MTARKRKDTCDLECFKIEDIKHPVAAVRPAWLQLIERWKDKDDPEQSDWSDEILPVLGYGVLKNAECWDSIGVYLVAEPNGPNWIKSGTEFHSNGCAITVALHLDIEPKPGTLPPDGFATGFRYRSGGLVDFCGFGWIYE